MNIVVMGPKGAGKTTVGIALAEELGRPWVDTDRIIETLDPKNRSCREIFIEDGEEAFRFLEREAAVKASELAYHVVITGGELMMNPDSRIPLRRRGVLILLKAQPAVLWERATNHGIPPAFNDENGEFRFYQQCALRKEVLTPFADIVLDTTDGVPEELAAALADRVGEELALRSLRANSFGEIIQCTTFGESHGKAIGVVLDGVRPGIAFDKEDIQKELDRRRPGQSKVVTQRREADAVEILSGVYAGKTTGAPLAMMIQNEDQRSKNYDHLKELFRPGHGDFTFYQKYGLRDHRGGGRQSGRETACRVAAGAFARKILANFGVRIVAHAVEIAGIQATQCDHEFIEKNPVRCADPDVAPQMEEAILNARAQKDSVGGVIQLEIYGLPPGLGDPVFGKLDARLCSAIMTIGAIKGVEVGDGFAITKLRGSQANDGMDPDGFTSNHHGGILGGISSGAPVLMRVAVKPTASIASKQHTVTVDGEPCDVEVKGRHDPCIVVRAVPVIENMAAFVLLDAFEMQARLNPDWAARYYPI
ncbi:MAG: chorismate synthase [Candidatus Hydrogenedentes bacterium]|jgi:chorismate synthase|nr:chorismate synthase [Candidatus Hydrogenedentota bacterium]